MPDEVSLEMAAVGAVAKFAELYNSAFSIDLPVPRVIMATKEYVTQSLAKVNGAKVFGTIQNIGGAYDTDLGALVVNPAQPNVVQRMNLTVGHELAHAVQFHSNPFCIKHMAEFWSAPADVDAFEWIKTVPGVPEPPYFTNGDGYNNAARLTFLVYEEGGAQWAHDRVLGFGTTPVTKDYDFSARVWAFIDDAMGRDYTKDLFLRGSPRDLVAAVEVANGIALPIWGKL